MSTGPKNRLAKETSPYLLQHAGNPVDWFPWGDEAFAKAAAQERPVFLSIGYSACHWCHVMERESFENEEIAAVLNRDFVSIKVDREERPDVDAIYMQAVQMMTGHGGWPMSMFLTPTGLPFYGGTYFPPEDGRGTPGFKRILQHVAHTYRERRGDVEEATTEIQRAISASFEIPGAPEVVTHEKLDLAAARIGQNFDAVHGGFGTAPKFPPSMTIDFLLQVVARGGNASAETAKIVDTTLRKMAMGGIYDQVGGGFHRYSVDAHWLVPHFEKMLYDNALLARVYVRGWQWSKEPLFRRIARETLDFVSRELTSPEGGFYSTFDADSEGEEGKFYVWSRDEIISVLGDHDGAIVCTLFGATKSGNFEGANILNLPREPERVATELGITIAELEEIASRAKCKLYGRREERIRPARDEKILASWNGWMLAAFAEASIAFGSGKDAATVRSSANFLIGKMSDGDHLFRSYKEGERKIGGMLEDYAGVAWGLLLAFDAVGDPRYLDAARNFANAIIERFSDDHGGFFDTASDHETLITRPRDLFDNATPSGNSLAAALFLRLAALDGDGRFEKIARGVIEQLFQLATRHPSGFGFLLGAAEWLTGSPREIVVTGPAESPAVATLFRTIGETFLPHRVIVTSAAQGSPLLEGRPADRALAYVCRESSCLEPTDDPKRLSELLRQN